MVLIQQNSQRIEGDEKLSSKRKWCLMKMTKWEFVSENQNMKQKWTKKHKKLKWDVRSLDKWKKIEIS